MNWFILALIAPFLWAITNHIDKYLISKQLERIGVGSIIVFAAIVDLILIPVIIFIEPTVLRIDLISILWVLASGMFFVYYLFPYYKALETDEASVVAPLFQMIPVVSYFVGLVFLHETLTDRQLLGGLLIILASIGISLELKHKMRLKTKTFFLMLLSSILIVAGAGIFKFVALEETFWSAIFWQNIGMIAASLLLLIKPSYRQQLKNLVVLRDKKLYLLMTFNELINIAAGMIISYSYLLAPLVLVQLVSSIQPLFVFVLGILLTRLIPQFNSENTNPKILIQKFVFILIIIAGTYFLLT